jgi:hypothetical protein
MPFTVTVGAFTEGSQGWLSLPAAVDQCRHKTCSCNSTLPPAEDLTHSPRKQLNVKARDMRRKEEGPTCGDVTTKPGSMAVNTLEYMCIVFCLTCHLVNRAQMPSVEREQSTKCSSLSVPSQGSASPRCTQQGMAFVQHGFQHQANDLVDGFRPEWPGRPGSPPGSVSCWSRMLMF